MSWLVFGKDDCVDDVDYVVVVFDVSFDDSCVVDYDFVIFNFDYDFLFVGCFSWIDFDNVCCYDFIGYDVVG